MNYYLGIDLGGTNIVSGIIDSNYNILSKSSIKTNCPRLAQEIMDDMYNVSVVSCEKIGISIKDITSIGIGTPGIVDSIDGIVEGADNLGFDKVYMKDYLEKKFNKKVFIENDANAAAYGEYIYSYNGTNNSVIAITLGTGVGSGIILDGKIYSGSGFAGAEIGHTVINTEGRMCICGRQGCFEAYSSATALIEMTKEYMNLNKTTLMWNLCNDNLNNVTGRTSFDAFKKNDKIATDLVNEYIFYLSVGILNIINIFQPNIICIGGGISKEEEVLINPIKDYINKYTYINDKNKLPIIMSAKLGNDAGVIGAGFLFQQYK